MDNTEILKIGPGYLRQGGESLWDRRISCKLL